MPQSEQLIKIAPTFVTLGGAAFMTGGGFLISGAALTDPSVRFPMIMAAIFLFLALFSFVGDRRAKGGIDLRIWKAPSALIPNKDILVLQVTNLSNTTAIINKLWLAGLSKGQEIYPRLREIPKTLLPAESLCGCISGSLVPEDGKWSKRGRAMLADGRILKSRLENNPRATMLTLLLMDEASRVGNKAPSA